MPTYSLLFIYPDEQIGESKRIECATDEQAMEIANQESGGHVAIQIWQGERPVALVGNPHAGGDGVASESSHRGLLFQHGVGFSR